MNPFKPLSLAISIALLSTTAVAVEYPPPSGKKIAYSPYPGRDYPNQVFFGTRTCIQATPPTPAWSAAP